MEKQNEVVKAGSGGQRNKDQGYGAFTASNRLELLVPGTTVSTDRSDL